MWIIVVVGIINIAIAYWMFSDAKEKKFSKNERALIFFFGLAFGVIGLLFWLAGIITPDKKSGKIEKVIEKAVEIVVIILILAVAASYGYSFLAQQYRVDHQAYGDADCVQGENCQTCSQDWEVCQTSTYCGNQVCDSGENCSGCPSDCGPCEKEYRTYISGGVVHWEFTDARWNKVYWTLPIETYKFYVSMPKNIQSVALQCPSCPTGTITTVDYRAFIQPEMFSGIIDSLTDGRTDKQFVDEVINMKSQLMIYKVTNETAQWPVETMTEGQGSCRDSVVLMASMLESGNRQANYGMKIQTVYLDLDHPNNPRELNHVVLYVKYRNGDAEFIETTADENVDVYERIQGWYFDINVETCETDGTIHGRCSGVNVGWYCDDGVMVPACATCGCPSDYPYCRKDGKCFKWDY